MSARDEGLEHAWAWFSHHSQQRFVTMNFYIVIAGAILAGAAALLKDGQQLACAFLGATQAILSVVFFLMDRRARRLVKIGEAALEAFQANLATQVAVPDLNLVQRSNVKLFFEPSYSRLFIAMYAVFFASGAVLAFNKQVFKLENGPPAVAQKPQRAAPLANRQGRDPAPPPVKAPVTPEPTSTGS